MTDTKQFTEQAQAQTLAMIRQSQETVVGAVNAWAEGVRQFVPTQSAAVDAGQLPKPIEVIDELFDFTETLLQAQREFTHNLIDAASPALQAAQSTTKRAANQAQSAASKAKAS